VSTNSDHIYNELTTNMSTNYKIWWEKSETDHKPKT